MPHPAGKDFAPFVTFQAATRSVAQQGNALNLCVNLTRTLLLDRDQPRKVPYFEKTKSIGFTNADVEVGGARFIYGWISLQDLAALEGRKLADVTAEANLGHFGYIHKKESDGTPMVFWPQNLRDSAKYQQIPLGLGHYEVSLRVGHTVNCAMSFDSSDTPKELSDKRAQILFMLESDKRPHEDLDEMLESHKANEIVALWTAFDEFVSAVGRFFVRRASGNPEYAYIRDMFWEASKRGSHKMLDFIETEINWERPPYNVNFNFAGKKVVFGKEEMLEVKELRNYRMHPRPTPHWRLVRSPRLRISGHKIITINDSYNSWAKLGLTAIAYAISNMFVAGKYAVRISGARR